MATLPEALVSRRRAWIPAWAAVFLLVMASSWGGNQFTPMLLLYKQESGYSTVTVNAFLAIYVLGLVPSLLLGGAFSDRRGRRPVALAGGIAALLASALLAFGALGQAPILAGRLFAGVAVGLAMAVGTSWLKELTPHDAVAAARRGALAFALGGTGGALVAGVIAEWGPWPRELPFVIHIVLILPVLWLAAHVPETRDPGGAEVTARVRLPVVGRGRLALVLVVMAPWLFAAAALAYGYLPVLLEDATDNLGLAYATLLTVVTLGTSSLVQPLARRLDRAAGALVLGPALAVLAAGLGLAALTASADSVLLGIVAALVLGAGIGVALVAGLLEVQRLARPEELAFLTGAFYAAAYVGFVAPLVLSAIPASKPLLLALLAAGALVAAGVVWAGLRRPAQPSRL